MSEYIQHTEEGQPYFAFSCSLGDLIAVHDNSIIYKHPFESRGVDHLFIEIADEGDSIRGAFMFRAETELQKPGVFDTIIGELEVYGWPEVLADEVSDCDQSVFDTFVSGKISKVTNKKIKAWLNE